MYKENTIVMTVKIVFPNVGVYVNFITLNLFNFNCICAYFRFPSTSKVQFLFP